MKSVLLFLLTTLPLLAGWCPCGTALDEDVDVIAQHICDTLVEIELLEPPTFSLDEFENEDGELEYYTAIVWQLPYHCEEGCVYRSDGFEPLYEFKFCLCEFSGHLGCPADTLSLIESLFDRIQEDYDSVAKRTKQRIDKLSSPTRGRNEKDRSELLCLRDQLAKYKETYSYHKARLNSLEPWVHKAYEDIFTNCLRRHGNDSAHYHLGFLAFSRGAFFTAMEELKKVSCFNDFHGQETHYHLGKTHNLLGLYDEAIETLTSAIEANPKNTAAYFERAAAYFEKGEFDKALADYIETNSILTPILDSSLSALEFAGGLLKGASHGATHALEHFVPSMLCSLQGLSNGLWSFACSPREVSKEIVQAASNVYDFIQNSSTLDTLRSLIPELDALIGDWSQNSEFAKGELVGTILGKYGTDAFLLAGSGKALKVYEELRVANTALTLNAMKDLEKQSQLLSKSARWHESAAERIKNIRGKAYELGKTYKNVNFTESEARKLLHNIGVKTFAVPKGLELKEFYVQVSQKGGGMKYISKYNAHHAIRVMPGNPNSAFASQRKPYVVHTRDGKFLDRSGRVVLKDSSEAHIPLEEFVFVRD